MQNTGSIALSSKELWPPKIDYINVYIKIAILGTPINCPGKLYLSKFRDMNMSDCNKSWSDHQKYDRAIQP
jgi:hypothetical protein